MVLVGETRAFFPVGPRVPGLHRIATIGDSLTYGAAVPPSQSLASHLETALNAAIPGAFFETVNLGRNGSNFWHAWSTFEYHFAPRGFDAVVFSICDNDTRLFEGNSVAYDESPWRGSFQFALLIDTLAQIKEFAERQRLLVILHYYTFMEWDIPLIAQVAEACGKVGVPFIDMRRFLIEEAGQIPSQCVASPLDGHPSGAVHNLAARRIVDEIVASGWFGEPQGPVDIAGETARLAATMRAQGRPVEQSLHWALRVLEAKTRSWQRRLTKPQGMALGDAAAVRDRFAAEFAIWWRGVALAAWADCLPAAERAGLWEALASYATWVCKLDELVYVLETEPDGDRLRAIADLLLSAEYYRARADHFATLGPNQLAAYRERATALIDSLATNGPEPPSNDRPPLLVEALLELTGQVLVHVERLSALAEAVHHVSSDSPRAALLRAAWWAVTQCAAWFYDFSRAVAGPLATVERGGFYTRIEILVEAPNGNDDNVPRTFLYVAVDYRRPARRRIVERQLCGHEKKRWVYNFEMPAFVLADVQVWVPPDAPAHDRFTGGATMISEIRIYDLGSGELIAEAAGFHWRRSEGEFSAMITLAAVRPHAHG